MKCGYSFEGQSFETHKPEPDSFFFCRLQETKNLDIAHSHFMCLNMCAALTVWALLASVLPADHKSAAVILCKKPGFGSIITDVLDWAEVLTRRRKVRQILLSAPSNTYQGSFDVTVDLSPWMKKN